MKSNDVVTMITQKGGFQGDVSIVSVETFPLDAKPTQNRILAYGESTGHNHQVVGKVDMRETAEAFYFQVAPDATEPVVVTHIGKEHGDIEMLPGIIWRVRKIAQVEYAGEEERQMRD